jgi:uncharacterized membrane protein
MRPANRIEKSTEILLWVYGVGLAGMLLPFSRELFITRTPLNGIFAALFLFYGRWPARRVLLTGLAVFVASFLVEAAGVNTGKIFGYYSYGSALGPKLWNTPLIIGLNWFVLIYCTNVISRQLWDLLTDRYIGRRTAAVHSGSAVSADAALNTNHYESPDATLESDSNEMADAVPGAGTATSQDAALDTNAYESPDAALGAGTATRSHLVWKSVFIIITASLLMVLYDLFLEPAAMRLDMWSWEGGRIPFSNYAAWFLLSVLFHTLVRITGEEKINSRALPLFAVQIGFFAVMDIFYLL